MTLKEQFWQAIRSNKVKLANILRKKIELKEINDQTAAMGQGEKKT